jgi:hypothetical protein
MLVQFARDVWNQHGNVLVGSLIRTLDGESLRMVGTLLAAIGDDDNRAAVERWLSEYERERATA